MHTPPLKEIDAHTLQHWMTHFIIEVRKNGDEYPPNMLHCLVCGIMHFLRQNGKPQVDYFKDNTFADFRSSLDGEMKCLQSKGIGSTSRQANSRWRRNTMAENSTPPIIVLHCVLHDRILLRFTKWWRTQTAALESLSDFIFRPGERLHLLYTENISKNRPGGLKERKCKPKVHGHTLYHFGGS